MRSFVWILAFSFSLAACGKLLWSDAEIQQQSDQCELGLAASSPAGQARAKRYCLCVYRAAAARWTYQDYLTRQTECEAELDKSVDSTCLAEAQ
ncbi:hypothetical protein K2X33_11615 [bacterium]|nr:hypothetical protein [bacterium]